MKICEINGDSAHCEAAGVYRDVSLMLVADQLLAPGDYVLVHTGYAIQKVPAPEARRCWEAYDAMQVARDIANHCTDPHSGGGQHA